LSIGVLSAILFVFIGLTKRMKIIKQYQIVATYPFCVIVCNHLLLFYVTPMTQSLPLPSAIFDFSPLVIALLVTFISDRAVYIFLALVSLGASFLLLSNISSSLVLNYTLLSFVAVLVFGLFFVLLCVVKKQRIVLLTIIRVMLYATYSVLVLGIWTPDNEACGAHRNMLVICDDQCSVITMELIYTVTPMVVTLLAPLVALGIFAIYGYSKGYRYSGVAGHIELGSLDYPDEDEEEEQEDE